MLARLGTILVLLVRQHEWRAERLPERQTPRLHELRELGGVMLPGTPL